MKEGDSIIDIESCLNAVKDAENPLGNNVKPEKNGPREKRLSTSSAKKPPRPPRGLSLDAADQKLIREISELTMIKRARIERMKALKKMKGAKGSGGSLVAVVFTVLFCVVVIFHGCHPLRILPSKGSDVGLVSSQALTGVTEGNIIVAVMDQRKPSTASAHGSSGSESPSFMELAPGLDNKEASLY